MANKPISLKQTKGAINMIKFVSVIPLPLRAVSIKIETACVKLIILFVGACSGDFYQKLRLVYFYVKFAYLGESKKRVIVFKHLRVVEALLNRVQLLGISVALP